MAATGESPYSFRLRSVREFKNKAIDNTYEVTFNHTWHGRNVSELLGRFRHMFRDLLSLVTTNYHPDDLIRVVIHHQSLHYPIIVALTKIENMTAEKIMNKIENTLNSNENLTVDETFKIDIGIIRIPRGGSLAYITVLIGDDSDLDNKRSITRIVNDDQLCMARAIAVGWAKLNQIDTDEFNALKANIDYVTDTESQVIHVGKVPIWYYKKLLDKSRKEQSRLAKTFSLLAGVAIDRPATLLDIPKFEQALKVNISIIGSRHGNRFMRVGKNDKLPDLYLYYVEPESTDDNVGHFHCISSITGVLQVGYFCHACKKAFCTKDRHKCAYYCIVCKHDGCIETQQVHCPTCKMTCRSANCFERHQIKKPRKDLKKALKSECDLWWKCLRCYKVLNKAKRDPSFHKCGEWYCFTCKSYQYDSDHLCFQRARKHTNTDNFKYIFLDFESTQNEIMNCEKGYAPSGNRCHLCSGALDPCISCRKCLNCNQSSCGSQEHRPNFVVAQTACNLCHETDITDKCEGCGTRCEHCGKMKDGKYLHKLCDTCGNRQVIFQGIDTNNKFCRWLFHKDHKNTVVFAHNMRGYDGYFLASYLLDNGITIKNIVYNGSKIMTMNIGNGLNMRILDSLNFLPMRLADLPKAFGLTEVKKGEFPHYFNSPENQNYIGPLPDVKFYGVDCMPTKRKEEFMQWYEKQKASGEQFDFRKEIEEYCVSDVTILRKACLCFRKISLDVTKKLDKRVGVEEVKYGEEYDTDTDDSESESEHKVKRKGLMKPNGVDPFKCTTIAGMCMQIYKAKFLREKYTVSIDNGTAKRKIEAEMFDGNTHFNLDGTWMSDEELIQKGWHLEHLQFSSSPIAQVPTTGYNSGRQYSKIAIQWLEWVMYTTGLHIRHALNHDMGEYRIGKYSVDGYCDTRREVYSFFGCIHHGCQVCFNPINPRQDDGSQVLHPFTKKTMQELYQHTIEREKTIRQQGYRVVTIWECSFKKQIRENRDGVSDFINGLDIAERLNARHSFFGGRTNCTRLHYKTSDGEKIHYVDFTSLYPYVNKYAKYPIGHPQVILKDFKDMHHYFGMAKVCILPPRGLYHPVIPYKSRGKLKFPLCSSCADEERVTPCICTDAQRALEGTWCTPEILKAVEKGYKVMKIYEVYHWDTTSQYDRNTGTGGLFTEYINAFLKLKQQASGWPSWCQTEEDKQKYIQDYYEHEGIMLEYDKIETNPGLRSLSKLALNSFWGKWAQRLDFKHNAIINASQPEKFFNLITDPTKELCDFHVLANDVIHLTWSHKGEFSPVDNKTNIFLASFTTCWARLKLYDVLDTLQTQVLYYDTDSVIYTTRPGEVEMPLGDFLGELTDEEPGELITEFISTGPKCYGYKTSSGKEVCKVRGFTLNYKNAKIINFDSVKHLVVNYNTDPNAHVDIQNDNIVRDKLQHKLYNRHEIKKYKMVYTKRVIQPDFNTLPYGF